MPQGLSLQKSKTRILTSAEFKATSPVQTDEVDEREAGVDEEVQRHQTARRLFRFSIRFDPYSPTAENDYELLKDELRQFDIMGLLRSELQKSRIHAALSKKIIQAIRYLDERFRDEAILSLLNNCDVLYPVFSSVLILLDKVYDDLSEQTKDIVIEKLRELIDSHSHIMRVDVHVSYAIRVISHQGTDQIQALLEQLYRERTSPIIRRDIILTFAKWRNWYWLSDIKNRYRELSGPERRAFIVASYTLRDEGKHWRKHIKDELSPFEGFIRSWAGEKFQDQNWENPL